MDQLNAPVRANACKPSNRCVSVAKERVSDHPRVTAQAFGAVRRSLALRPIAGRYDAKATATAKRGTDQYHHNDGGIAGAAP